MKKSFLILTLLFSFSSKIIAQPSAIEISYERNDDKSVDINYVKNIPGSLTLNISFPILENSFQDNFQTVVKNFSGTLLTLTPINNNEHIRFSTSTRYSIGEVNPKVDKNFTYLLPYKNNKSIRIIEAFSLNEKYFGEQKASSWKNFIVDTKTPDTICAMRKGTVIDIVAKHDAIMSYDKKYTSSLNRIIIEHSDGTYSSYKGLNKHAIFVKLGQTVFPNTQLGTLNLFDRSNNNSKYRLYFHIGYYTKPKSTNHDQKTKAEYVDPYFLTSNGISKISHGKDYTSKIIDAIIKEELSRKEKKRFKKTPKLFK